MEISSTYNKSTWIVSVMNIFIVIIIIDNVWADSNPENICQFLEVNLTPNPAFTSVSWSTLKWKYSPTCTVQKTEEISWKILLKQLDSNNAWELHPLAHIILFELIATAMLPVSIECYSQDKYTLYSCIWNWFNSSRVFDEVKTF